MDRISPSLHRVRSRVEACLREFPAIDGSSGLLVACSGGPDSLALAAAAAHLDRPVGAVVVDHGLQPGSAEVARVAAGQCEALGLSPVMVVAVDATNRGEGPEAAARNARYGALSAAARDSGALVLLGHTLDDQAETVLLAIARGSGTRSLAGMPASRGVFRRPMLGLTRAEVRSALDGLDIVVWEDPHNSDPAFRRSRIRNEVLPVLDDVMGPGVRQALARTASLTRADADALDGWAARVTAELGGSESVGSGWSVGALGGLPTAVRRRVLRGGALSAGCPAGALAASHILEVDRLITEWHGQGPLHLPGGVTAARRYGRLFLTGPTTAPDPVNGARDGA